MFTLQLCFFGKKSTFVGNNIRPGLNTIEPIYLYKTNSKYFSKKALENLLHLYLAFNVKSNGIFNTNKKKYRTGLLTQKISNLIWNVLVHKMSYFGTFIRVLGP